MLTQAENQQYAQEVAEAFALHLDAMEMGLSMFTVMQDPELDAKVAAANKAIDNLDDKLADVIEYMLDLSNALIAEREGVSA